VASLSERAHRSLCEQISEAQQRLAAARLDGNYRQIRFWLDRENLLLDRLNTSKEPA
jgi:hypothetical protein